MQRLVNSIQMSDRIPHHQKVNSPGRDIVYIPSFSWQYMGRGMRPLMEALCWVLAAMTAGLHEVAPALHPSAGWDFEPRSSFGEEKHLHGGRRLSTDLSFVEEEDGSKKLNSTLTRKACTTAGTQEKIAVGVIMERRDNHSPHRLIHGVLKGLDRSRFRVLAFVRDYIGEYPLAGRAVIQSADEVVVLPWHTFATGTSDPFREREVIAASQASDNINMFRPIISQGVDMSLVRSVSSELIAKKNEPSRRRFTDDLTPLHVVPSRSSILGLLFVGYSSLRCTPSPPARQ